MTEDEIVKDYAWELSSTLSTLLWSLERGIGTQERIEKARDLRDRMRQKREQALRDATQLESQ